MMSDNNKQQHTKNIPLTLHTLKTQRRREYTRNHPDILENECAKK